jgi:hypothetical protein
MPRLGILFDIDELDGGDYGYAAYKVFFDAVDTRQIAGASLSDGDTNATLAGEARHYCIAVDSFDLSNLATVEKALSKSDAKGLLPISSRFVEEVLLRHEPLVQAAYIDAIGGLVERRPGWLKAAWTETRKRHEGS